MIMNDKMNFAQTINSFNMPPMSECENYGMTWGCDIDCPVLRAGDCKLKNCENAELYKEFLNEEEN